jgi:tRNA 2-thiouridine synthesizing protein E
MPGTDINRYILNERAIEQDPEGFLLELPPWSIARGRELAAEENIEMTDEHWDVVCFLRERFVREGQAKSGRQVVQLLEERYGSRGGRRHLYTLFPNGPVTQGSRIAGLPLPPYTTDPHFGSSE